MATVDTIKVLEAAQILSQEEQNEVLAKVTEYNEKNSKVTSTKQTSETTRDLRIKEEKFYSQASPAYWEKMKEDVDTQITNAKTSLSKLPARKKDLDEALREAKRTYAFSNPFSEEGRQARKKIKQCKQSLEDFDERKVSMEKNLADLQKRLADIQYTLDKVAGEMQVVIDERDASAGELTQILASLTAQKRIMAQREEIMQICESGRDLNTPEGQVLLNFYLAHSKEKPSLKTPLTAVPVNVRAALHALKAKDAIEKGKRTIVGVADKVSERYVDMRGRLQELINSRMAPQLTAPDPRALPAGPEER